VACRQHATHDFAPCLLVWIRWRLILKMSYYGTRTALRKAVRNNLTVIKNSFISLQLHYILAHYTARRWVLKLLTRWRVFVRWNRHITTKTTMTLNNKPAKVWRHKRYKLPYSILQIHTTYSQKKINSFLILFS
jgi:hypothetical protein